MMAFGAPSPASAYSPMHVRSWDESESLRYASQLISYNESLRSLSPHTLHRVLDDLEPNSISSSSRSTSESKHKPPPRHRFNKFAWDDSTSSSSRGTRRRKHMHTPQGRLDYKAVSMNY